MNQRDALGLHVRHLREARARGWVWERSVYSFSIKTDDCARWCQLVPYQTRQGTSYSEIPRHWTQETLRRYWFDW